MVEIEQEAKSKEPRKDHDKKQGPDTGDAQRTRVRQSLESGDEGVRSQ